MTAQDRRLVLIGVCIGFFIGVVVATGFWFVIVEQMKDIMRQAAPLPVIESQLMGVL